MNNKLNSKNVSIWIIIIVMKFTSKLPIFTHKYIILIIGFIIKPFLKNRNNITKENFKIAFPEKSNNEIKKLVKKSYYSMILSGAEIIAAWFFSEKKFNKIKFKWESKSMERFKKYHNDNKKKLIILGFHFHCLEIIGRYIGQEFPPFTVIYQKNDNILIEYLIKKYREKNLYKCINSKNFISIIKTINKGYTIWYAPDQDFGLKNNILENSIFVPFFGKLCSTLTVTPWLAQKTGAIVIPAYYIREKCLKKYKITIGKPFYFIGDDYKDAEKINKFLENAIKKYPEQYLWQHRRYKTRPNNEPQIY